MLDHLLAFDTKIFLWLNSFHSPAWDSIMWHISGKLEWLPIYLLLIGYIIYHYRWKSIPVFVAIGIAVTLADQLSVIAFKETIQRLRPTHNPEIGHLVHIVNEYRGGSFGFISNHAANSFSLAVFISLLIQKRKLTLFMIFWACTVSYSRIYLGVHYPGDIVGGALFGSLLGWLLFRLYLSTASYLYGVKKEKAVNG